MPDFVHNAIKIAQDNAVSGSRPNPSAGMPELVIPPDKPTGLHRKKERIHSMVSILNWKSGQDYFLSTQT